MTTTDTTIGINGMAHVMLTVSQFAAARAFYGRLLPALGMTPVCDTDKLFYCVGARTAIGIQPAGPAHDGDRFAQSRVGHPPSAREICRQPQCGRGGRACDAASTDPAVRPI
jgi:catechol 2,3-dioxygenase-like lactoylglutathione lyase family enzyme